jgi:hypothetical protein
MSTEDLQAAPSADDDPFPSVLLVWIKTLEEHGLDDIAARIWEAKTHTRLASDMMLEVMPIISAIGDGDPMRIAITIEHWRSHHAPNVNASLERTAEVLRRAGWTVKAPEQ